MHHGLPPKCGHSCDITFLHQNQTEKLAKRADSSIFLGYEETKLNGFRIYDLEANKFVTYTI